MEYTEHLLEASRTISFAKNEEIANIVTKNIEEMHKIIKNNIEEIQTWIIL